MFKRDRYTVTSKNKARTSWLCLPSTKKVLRQLLPLGVATTDDSYVHTYSKAFQREIPSALTYVKTEMHPCCARRGWGMWSPGNPLWSPGTPQMFLPLFPWYSFLPCPDIRDFICSLVTSSLGEGDDRGWDGLMASPTQWTWVWVNSGSWWWTGRPGVLQFMGLQIVRHDWATELNWTEHQVLS